MTQGTHLQGSALRDGSASCSWLTSEASRLQDLTSEALRLADGTTEAPADVAMRSFMEYSSSMSFLEICGSKVSTPAVGFKSWAATSPATDASSLAASATCSFHLGVPFVPPGLDLSGLQEAPKHPREVSAILPRVACLEFNASSQVPVAKACEVSTAAVPTAPAVPAATLANQLWTPNPLETRWRRLGPTEFSSSAPTAVAPPTMSGRRVAATAKSAAMPEATSASSALAMPADVSRSSPQLLAEVCEQTLRKPRTIFSNSGINPTLPSRRLSMPSGLTQGHRPGTAPGRAGSSPSPAMANAVLKVPPNRDTRAVKSLEAVINERRRDALERFDTSPVLTPRGTGDAMAHTLAGLAADLEEDDIDLGEEFLS